MVVEVDYFGSMPRQFLTGMFFVCFSLLNLFWFIPDQVPVLVITDTGPTPVTFPIFICMAMMFLGIILVVLGAKELKERQPKKAVAIEQTSRIRLFVSIVSMFIYVLTTEYLGFRVSTFLFLLFFSRMLGYQKYLQAISFSVLSTACIYAVFTYLIQIPLPRGVIGW